MLIGVTGALPGFYITHAMMVWWLKFEERDKM